jgi:hypothetical protein
MLAQAISLHLRVNHDGVVQKAVQQGPTRTVGEATD